MRHGKLDDSFMGPAIFNEGEAFVNDAWEAPTPAKRISLARQALVVDLDNIDAYVILGDEAKSTAERIALLREAVHVGDRLWAPLLDDPAMEWWGFMGTRPYMRAMHNLALALEEAGDMGETEKLYQRLLSMNPNDNQGVRCLLIRLYMAVPRVGDLRALLKQYPDDAMIESVMAHLWLNLRRKGADMQRLGPDVAQRNAHILPMLAGHRPKTIERSPYGITMGGADEAEEYVAGFGEIWARNQQGLAAIRAYTKQNPKATGAADA